MTPIDPDLVPDFLRGDPNDHVRTRDVRNKVPHWQRFDLLGLVAIGGFAGALARYEVSGLWTTPAGGFPEATFVINTSGAFAIGLLLPLLLMRRRGKPHLQMLLVTGVLGAWTTMSTFAMESDLLAGRGGSSIAVAVGYVAATVVAGLGATWIAQRFGQGLITLRNQER